MLNRLVRSLAPALVLAALPVASFAGVAIGVSINIAPPALPVYVQPAPPGADYIWTPGYWAWGDDGGYYWVPGTWVARADTGSAVDAWLLGLGRRRLHLARRLLGSAHRLLRRRELRVWLRRRRL